MTSLKSQVEQVLRELVAVGQVQAGQIVVIGCSTSEVMGQRIGTSGAEHVAEQIFAGVEQVSTDIGFYPAFQCCEHLNRALVVNRELLHRYTLTQVAAVPVAKAGGSMASYAFRHLTDACLVETIQANAGIDIGDTLIGMHLRRVAVPARPTIKRIGEAHVNMAYTRPPYIGGPRTVYQLEAQDTDIQIDSCE
jgi:uncharacterized protein (TIGR01440 family)